MIKINFEARLHNLKGILPEYTELSHKKGRYNFIIQIYVPNLTDKKLLQYTATVKSIFGGLVRSVYAHNGRITYTIESSHFYYKSAVKELGMKARNTIIESIN